MQPLTLSALVIDVQYSQRPIGCSFSAAYLEVAKSQYLKHETRVINLWHILLNRLGGVRKSSLDC